MPSLKSICVFCGSSFGARPEFEATARELGRLIAQQGLTLVYGGSSVGLMGAVADAATEAGGRVVGVIPESLQRKEIAHRGLTELHVTGSMHERKALMAELSDAFIAMPGGFGTFEEFCEVVTWSQLGLHRKPCGLLNVAGYYDPMLAQFDRAVTEAFLKPVHRALVFAAPSPAELIDKMSQTELPQVEKWIGRPQT